MIAWSADELILVKDPPRGIPPVARVTANAARVDVDPPPEWVVFMIVVSEFAFVGFYDVDLPDDATIDERVNWNHVVGVFDTRVGFQRLDALVDIDHKAGGAKARSGSVESTRDKARAEVPEEIRKLLLLATFGGGSMQLGPGTAFRKRYDEMLTRATDIWDAWKRGETAVAAVAPAAKAPKDEPEEEEEEEESEEDEFERLARRLASATLYDKYVALRDLRQRRGCGSVVRFSASAPGKRIGIADNEALWKLMSDSENLRNPPVVRTETVGKGRRVLKRPARFVLAVSLETKAAWVDRAPSEYTYEAGAERPVYAWHQYYVDSCRDKTRRHQPVYI